MNKVKDLSLTLFQEIANVKELKVFDYISPVLMDTLYNNSFSEKFVSKLVTENTKEDVAKIIVGLYGEKWDSILSYVINVRESANYIGGKTTTTHKNTQTLNTQNETTNTISAYNTEDFTNNDKDTTSNTGTVTDESETTITTKDVKNVSRETFNYLQSNYLFDTIFLDVNSICTLSIFSFE